MASSEPETASSLDRLRALTVPVLVAAALVFAGLAVFGVVAPMPALAGFLAVAAGMLSLSWVRASASANTRAQDAERGASQAALTETVIDNLSDPTVLLDGEGRVLHLNALGMVK